MKNWIVIIYYSLLVLASCSRSRQEQRIDEIKNFIPAGSSGQQAGIDQNEISQPEEKNAPSLEMRPSNCSGFLEQEALFEIGSGRTTKTVRRLGHYALGSYTPDGVFVPLFYFNNLKHAESCAGADPDFKIRIMSKGLWIKPKVSQESSLKKTL